MLGCFVLASCINDEEGPCLPDSSGKTQVHFSLVLQDNAQTRADAVRETWGSFKNPEVGVGYDNQIDLGNVQFLLFKENVNEETNKKNYLYAGKLEKLTYTILGDPRTPDVVYDYIGEAPKDLESGNYKFVVLANTTAVELADNTDITATDFANLAFNYLGSGELPKIPMWGTKGVDAMTKLDLIPGTNHYIGRISLLRAVSKVTVTLTGEPEEDLNGYSLEKVTVSKYNKYGYVLPSKYADVTSTTELVIDEENTMHVNAASTGADLAYEVAATGDKEITFYLPEYKNSADAPVKVLVKLTKKVTDQDVPREFEFPIRFCEYSDLGAPIDRTDYSIIRNHHYQFNIFKVTDAGALYVKPTVAPWTNAPELEYTINMSTSMRLFDSWLYRYDIDGKYDDWKDDWSGSHMAVAPGVDASGKPQYSPQIQLVTTNPDGKFELRLDNDKFQFIQVTKNEDGSVYQYKTSSPLVINEGTNTYTYFYVVPKPDATFSDAASKIAKVSLIYIDDKLGEMKMPFNNSSLPGFANSTEIWVYYFPVSEYNITGKLKMYYQDEQHPLVPTPVQN